jgi:hypothetical protein
MRARRSWFPLDRGAWTRPAFEHGLLWTLDLTPRDSSDRRGTVQSAESITWSAGTASERHVKLEVLANASLWGFESPSPHQINELRTAPLAKRTSSMLESAVINGTGELAINHLQASKPSIRASLFACDNNCAQ